MTAEAQSGLGPQEEDLGPGAADFARLATEKLAPSEGPSAISQRLDDGTIASAPVPEASPIVEPNGAETVKQGVEPDFKLDQVVVVEAPSGQTVTGRVVGIDAPKPGGGEEGREPVVIVRVDGGDLRVPRSVLSKLQDPAEIQRRYQEQGPSSPTT